MDTPHEPAPTDPDLSAQLARYITSWVARVSQRCRDEMCLASITIRLDQPQGEENGTLYLDFTIDETITAERSGGRVTGQRFDPSPAPGVSHPRQDHGGDGPCFGCAP